MNCGNVTARQLFVHFLKVVDAKIFHSFERGDNVENFLTSRCVNCSVAFKATVKIFREEKICSLQINTT
ncbi:MAG: hypothetical protein IKN27_03330 [Selenomonadaceae bacterium]|nr:hypothetical protein [Selenomonadaceae bacterium]